MSDNGTRHELDDLQKEFLETLQFMVESVEESFLKLDSPENRKIELTNIFRVIHSIKGAAGAVGFEDLSAFAHIIEDYLQILRVHPELITRLSVTVLLKSIDLIKQRAKCLERGENTEWLITDTVEKIKKLTSAGFDYINTLDQQLNEYTADPGSDVNLAHDEIERLIKIDVAFVDRIHNFITALLEEKNKLLNLPEIKLSTEAQAVLANLEKKIIDLKNHATAMRMTNLKDLFRKAQRLTRDLSVKLKKPVALAIDGDTVRVDRILNDLITDPLMHLIRNAVDHGIEATAERSSAGKLEVGMISIRVRESDDNYIFEVKDDGNGIDKAAVITKARNAGLISDGKNDQEISEKEAYSFLFTPGFSTSKTITSISGRGVGLDVVKTNIEKLQGVIDIESKPGKGTIFRITIPKHASNQNYNSTAA